MRIILFTGKGGVGKTTTAAATALQCARLGQKTLVISTDPAHSLSDALNLELGPEPVPIGENLWGQEFDVYYSMKKYWGNMRQLMLTIFKWQGVQNVLAEELSAMPGMEEASAFLWLEKYYTENFYDTIIIDSAPTGETLTLLTLPQVIKSWVGKALPTQSFAMRTVGSVVRRTTGVPLDYGMQELETLFDKLESIQKVFLNPEICSIRIVCNPERMVVQEAKRAYTYLQLYGYNVDAVIVNRVLPEAASEGAFFQGYLKSQKAHLTEIEESFQPLPILKMYHLGKEVFGVKLLEHIAETLYANTNPADIFHNESPIKVVEDKKYYQVQIRLPFVEEDDIELSKYGDELLIEVENRRKSVFLPRFTNFLEMKDYWFEAPILTVRLHKKAV